MIKSNELRVGNWVLLEKNGEKKFYDVCAHDIEEIEGCGDDVFPIPLTHDIMWKAGYIKNGFHQYDVDISVFPGQYKKISIDLNQGYIYLREEGRIAGRRDEDHLITIWNRDLVKEYHLHQLQNLYFLMMGKELPINLI